MLSDRSISKAIETGEIRMHGIDRQEQFQPVSIDLQLDDVCGATYWDGNFGRQFRIPARHFFLGSTIEWIELGPNIAGQVHGKSTRARQGLIVEAAGLVDPGFQGNLTLEIFNMSNDDIVIDRGDLVAQICFHQLSTTPAKIYGHPSLNNHYQGQRGPTPARGI